MIELCQFDIRFHLVNYGRFFGKKQQTLSLFDRQYEIKYIDKDSNDRTESLNSDIENDDP